MKTMQLDDQIIEQAKIWAADDRLWGTQEVVELNLRKFAALILQLYTFHLIERAGPAIEKSFKDILDQFDQ